MVVVAAHEPSALFLGQGFVLVDLAHALEFEDEQIAAAFLERYASEPCYTAAELTAAA
jgi:hypothetical protein